MQEDCVRGESLKATVKATRKEGGDKKEQPNSTSVGQTPVLKQGQELLLLLLVLVLRKRKRR